MADRRITVLNPGGFQEVLQTADRLLVDSSSQLAETDFTGTVSGTDGAFSGSLTVQAVPTNPKDVVTLDFLEDVELDLTLTAAEPITITNNVIGINAATETAVGAIRIATDAEVNSRADVDAAVTPGQLDAALDAIIVNGVAPIEITEDPTNTWTVDIAYATKSTSGAIRFATDLEATTGTIDTVGVTPAQVKQCIDNIPYATTNVPGIIQLATGQEALNGVVNNKAVTPDQLKAKVDTVSVTGNNPIVVTQYGTQFDVDINSATEITVGVVRFATNAEASAGISTSTAITPAQLESRVGGLVIVDASTTVKGIVQLATNSEAAAGTDTAKAIVPASMRYALDQPDYVLDGGSY